MRSSRTRSKNRNKIQTRRGGYIQTPFVQLGNPRRFTSTAAPFQGALRQTHACSSDMIRANSNDRVRNQRHGYDFGDPTRTRSPNEYDSYHRETTVFSLQSALATSFLNVVDAKVRYFAAAVPSSVAAAAAASGVFLMLQ